MNDAAGSVFGAEWMQLATTLDLVPAAAAAVGDELLTLHQQAHRSYHTDRHIVAVINHLRTLEAATPTALLAAFFHDAIYDATRGDNEERSAVLAVERGGDLGVEPSIVDDVATIIRATAGHQLPMDPPVDAAAFLDADLAILGASVDAYAAYAAAITAEYAHMDPDDFRRGRAAVLEHLLSLDPLFHTPVAQSRWHNQAHQNLHTELATLRNGVNGV